jgi:glutamate carboxypeptidase
MTKPAFARRALACAALFLPLVASAQLSAPEQAVAAAVDKRQPEALALLEQIVNINSGTLNFAGVRQVGDILRAQLDQLGFQTRWVDGAPFHRAGHLVAEHAAPGPKIVLVGHLDTVFEPSSPFQKFARGADGMASGPGIIDMKGGDVVMITALKALADAGLLASINVTAVFDGDEESAGLPVALARAALVDAARGAVAAVGFEDGPGDPKFAVVARRSATFWRLRTSGRGGHASQIFRDDLGAGALNEAARILHQFYTELAGERYLAFSGGLALGGTGVTVDAVGSSGTARGKSNVIADQVVVSGDMRTISPEQLSRVQDAMRAIVARHLPHTDAQVEFENEYPPLPPSEGNRRLLAMYDRASQDLGAGPVLPVDPARAGAADVSFLAPVVPMIIDGIGLSGHDDHSDKETADLGKLPSQAKRAAVLLLRLSKMASVPTAAKP